MKPIVIKKLTRVTRCELFMCGTMATHSIATPDSPPGQCFLLCLDHMLSLRGALNAMAEDTPVVEPFVEPLVEPFVEPFVEPAPIRLPDLVPHKPAVPEKAPVKKAELAGAAAGWDEMQKKRNAFSGDAK